MYNKEDVNGRFDENYRFIIFTYFQVSGLLYNTGQSLVFRVDKDTKQHVNISGGALAYRYQFEEIYIHYGMKDEQGSEHRIKGYTFPGEVSIHLHFISTEYCPDISDKSDGIRTVFA